MISLGQKAGKSGQTLSGPKVDGPKVVIVVDRQIPLLAQSTYGPLFLPLLAHRLFGPVDFLAHTTFGPILDPKKR